MQTCSQICLRKTFEEFLIDMFFNFTIITIITKFIDLMVGLQVVVCSIHYWVVSNIAYML
jgi:hypothetical protein